MKVKVVLVIEIKRFSRFLLEWRNSKRTKLIQKVIIILNASIAKRAL